MKLIKVIVLVAACVSLLSVPAYSATVDFDGIPSGTNIEGSNLGGVTITSQNQDTYVTGSFGVGFRSAPNSVTNGGFLRFNTMTFTFDQPVSQVSFTGGDEGGDTDQFQVKLYDLSNSLFFTFTTPVYGGNPIDPLVMVDFFDFSYSGAEFKYMTVNALINAGIGIDDLQFSRVPEPSTLLLLGSGLLGLAGWGRKRFRK